MANSGVPLSRAKLEDLTKELEYHQAAARQREMVEKRKAALDKAREVREAAKKAAVHILPKTTTKEEAKAEAKTIRKPSAKKNKNEDST